MTTRYKTREEFEIITAVRIYGRNYKSVHHAALAIAHVMARNVLRRQGNQIVGNWHVTMKKLQTRAYRRIKPAVAYTLAQSARR